MADLALLRFRDRASNVEWPMSNDEGMTKSEPPNTPKPVVSDAESMTLNSGLPTLFSFAFFSVFSGRPKSFGSTQKKWNEI
jgi:hypothetical protein